MKITRRWFLKTLAALGLSAVLPGASSAAPSESVLFMNMDALTDAIMPGAEGLGIHRKVRESVSKRAETARICAAGLEAIEKYSMNRYGKSFHALNSPEKETVLRWMDEMPVKKLEGFFFRKFRMMVLALYYTSPEAWKTLRYNGPPQPNGFMDYHLPPEGTNERSGV